MKAVALVVTASLFSTAALAQSYQQEMYNQQAYRQQQLMFQQQQMQQQERQHQEMMAQHREMMEQQQQMLAQQQQRQYRNGGIDVIPGQMVGGFYVAPNPGQYFNQVIQKWQSANRKAD